MAQTENHGRPGASFRVRVVEFPSEIICDILSRLPIEALIRSKVVCKSWDRLTKETHFIDLQYKIASSHEDQRIILAPRGGCNKGSLFLKDETKSCWKYINLPKEHDKNAGTCNGLVCMVTKSNGDDKHPPLVYLCNPVTREYDKLPSLDYELAGWEIFHYGFGYDSSNKIYKVIWCCVGIITKGMIITVGEDSWRRVVFPYNVLFRCNNTLFCDGAFHWIIHGKNFQRSDKEQILRLNISTEKFDTPVVNIPRWSPCLSGVAQPLLLAHFDSYVTTTVFRIREIAGSETKENTCSIPHAKDTGYCKILGVRFGKTLLYRMQRGWGGDCLAIYDFHRRESWEIPTPGAPANAW